MAEQWELDAQDESNAQSHSQVQAQLDEAEVKNALRKERRRLADQKRRARKAAEARAQKMRDSEGTFSGVSSKAVNDKLSAVAEMLNYSPKHSQSPAPTAASSDDPGFRGANSGWNSGEESDNDRIRMDIQTLQKIEDDEFDAYDLLENLAS